MATIRCDAAVPAPAALARTERSGRPASPGDALEQRMPNRTAQLPVPVAEEWNWQLSATCRGMEVELFFHPARERKGQKQRRIEQAKAICQDCPVLEECRRHALQTREPYGIWGGLSEDERAAILGVGNLRYPAAARRSSSGPGPLPVPMPVPMPVTAMSGRPTTASSA